MKLISKVILILSLLLITYGYWGAFTESGNKIYDEMDAMFPFFMLIFGAMVLISVLIFEIVRRKKVKR